MLGKMIAGILGLIKKGEIKQAEENLEDIYYNMLKEDAAYFRDIPENKLTDTLLGEHNYTNGHLEILAELFNAEAELALAKDDKTGCLEYSRKSIRLFEFIDNAEKTYFKERIDKMNSIREKISRLAEGKNQGESFNNIIIF